MPDARPHALYRFFDADETLLYVGITLDPSSRWRKHRGEKPWWSDVARIEVEAYPDRTSVELAEQEAIRDERPLYNIQHNGATAKITGDALVLICDVCERSVEQRGHLVMRNAELSRVERLEQAWNEEVKARIASGMDELWARCMDTHALMTYVDTARWLIRHEACDEHDEEGYFPEGYYIDINEPPTAGWLLDRSAHLIEKGWLHRSDWPALIRAARSALPVRHAREPLRVP